MALGTVHIPRAVKADGKPLPAGTYQVRLTAEESKPDAAGASEKLERWVEFVQKGSVKGREVVPAASAGRASPTRSLSRRSASCSGSMRAASSSRRT